MGSHFFRKYTAWLILPLLGLAGIGFFFYHFGHGDATALADFSVAYQSYDQAMAAYASPVLGGAPAPGDVESQAAAALAELQVKASTRISSLTRHDGDLMPVMAETAGLAGQEMAALKAYQAAASDKSADLGSLSTAYQSLASQRQAAYARFRGLLEAP